MVLVAWCLHRRTGVGTCTIQSTHAIHARFSKVYKVSQLEEIKVYNGIEIKRKSKHVYVLSQQYAISQSLVKAAVQAVNPRTRLY